MENAVVGNKKIYDFLHNLRGVAQKEGWVSRYDIESDSFSFTVPTLSDDARLRYLGNEVALYFTKNKDIEGVFIEYFKSNFVKHHENLSELLKDIDEKVIPERGLIELNKKKVIKVISSLEEAIQVSLIESLTLKSSV